MLTLIPILSFITVGLFVIGLTMKGEQALVRERVESLRLLLEQDIEQVVPELSSSFGDRVFRPWLRKVAELFARMVPANALANIAVKLERAGNPWRLKPAEVVGLRVISFFLFLGIGLFFGLRILVDSLPLYRLLAVIVGLAVGYLLPDALLDHAVGERQKAIRKSLADCLDLLVVCAEAGLGFDGAVGKLVERTRGPLADEFKRMLQEMSIGRTRMEALKAMAKRIGISEVTTFVAAIHQADLLGVSIAQVLRVQADTMRSHRNLRAREFAAKLPVKMLFPLVLFIFPAIFVVLLAPSYMSIYRAFANVGR